MPLCTSMNMIFMGVIFPILSLYIFDPLIQGHNGDGSPNGSEFLPHEDKYFRRSMCILYIQKST